MSGRKARDWSDANAVLRGSVASGCRVCRSPHALERAHLIRRGRDARTTTGRRVGAHEVIWLCGPFPTGCHGAFDHGRLDLYPHLSDDELRAATRRAGSPGAALRALSGPLWRLGTSGAQKTIDARLRALEALG